MADTGCITQTRQTKKAKAPFRFNRNEALDEMEAMARRGLCAAGQKIPATKRASIPDMQMPKLMIARYRWI